MTPGKIFIILTTTLLAGIAFALIFIACAAMAQERHGEGRGGGWGGGGRDHGGGGYSRPGPSGGSNVTINKYYGGRGGGGGGRQYYHDRRPGYSYVPGYGWYNPSAVVGGAIGGWLYKQFAQPEPPPPPVVVVQQPAPEPFRTVGWCLDRYKSYDVQSRTYLGYDGYRHSCP